MSDSSRFPDTPATPDETVLYLSDPVGTPYECADGLREEMLGDDHRRLLAFSITESPEKLDEEWDQFVGEDISPNSVALVIATPSPKQGDYLESESGTPVSVVYTNPNDLTGITIAVSRVLESWSDHPIAVCLRDLDTLTMYHDSDTVFQFANSLVQSLGDANTHTHAHVRPGMLEESELTALAALFDRVEGDTEKLS